MVIKLDFSLKYDAKFFKRIQKESKISEKNVSSKSKNPT